MRKCPWTLSGKETDLRAGNKDSAFPVPNTSHDLCSRIPKGQKSRATSERTLSCAAASEPAGAEATALQLEAQQGHGSLRPLSQHRALLLDMSYRSVSGLRGRAGWQAGLLIMMCPGAPSSRPRDLKSSFNRTCLTAAGAFSRGKHAGQWEWPTGSGEPGDVLWQPRVPLELGMGWLWG